MKRVLFVDDESRILEGIRRMMRPYRHEWDMHFATSGEEALTLLAGDDFDLIVSDMRMPGMDGSELLTRVKDVYPHIVRIVLSGHADLGAMLRALSVAHHFLSKPCEAETLRTVFLRASALKELLEDPRLKRIIGNLSSLPPIPSVYAALMAALQDPSISIPGVARLVERDTGISAKILHIANSGFFGLRKEVLNIEQAINQLGLRLVKNLVLSVELFDPSALAGHPLAAEIDAMQQHSLLVAGIAMEILPNRRNLDELFVAGLLHDIGKRLLAIEDAEQYACNLSTARDTQQPLQAIEQDHYGVTHAEIGAYLLNMWGLPHSIVETIAHHHAPWRLPTDTFGLPHAVYIADVLAYEIAGDAKAVSFNIPYLRELGVADQIEAWRELAGQHADRHLTLL